jgi:hypothetical protein
MNGGGEEAMSVLMEEIDSAVSDIRASSGAKGCEAHSPMARGMIVLLRCQRAHIDQQRRVITIAGTTSAIVTATLWLIAHMTGALPSIPPVP